MRARAAAMQRRYEIHGKLHEGARSTLSRATRVSSGEQVVLKESALDASSQAALLRSQQEFELAAPMRSSHVVGYLGVERFQNRAALVVEAVLRYT